MSLVRAHATDAACIEERAGARSVCECQLCEDMRVEELCEGLRFYCGEERPTSAERRSVPVDSGQYDMRPGKPPLSTLRLAGVDPAY